MRSSWLGSLAVMLTSISALRLMGMRLIVGGGWFVTVLLIVATAYYREPSPLISLASGLLNVPATICVLRKQSRDMCRLITGATAAVQPVLLSIAMVGTHWHTEVHMLFFVALVTLLLLCDHRPILIASAIIIMHDFALVSDLLGSGTGDTESSLIAGIHTTAIIAICAVLSSITLGLGRVMIKVETSRRKSDQQADLLKEQAGELQEALHRVEIERQAREQAEREKTEQRKADSSRFAREFENSVAQVIMSVGSTAKVLEQTTKQLDRIAQENDARAAAYSDSAQTASKAARRVALGVAELSDSIAKIAVTASQQENLTTRATERVSSGGDAMGSLGMHSDTIEEATRAIVRIADRTDLLSLNAAIEAASAGPAGRGFTAVAQEVKALATQASETATEIDAFLNGVRSGTREAERSFTAIDEAIVELNAAAKAIRSDVDEQRLSADTIQEYAGNAASEVQEMSERSKSLAASAETTKQLSAELDRAATALLNNVRELEAMTGRFSQRLRAA